MKSKSVTSSKPARQPRSPSKGQPRLMGGSMSASPAPADSLAALPAATGKELPEEGYQESDPKVCCASPGLKPRKSGNSYYTRKAGEMLFCP